MNKILVATHNPGKIAEYRTLFGVLKLAPEMMTLKDLKISAEPEENGQTFEANAIVKADFYASMTDLPVLAEDSGLEIDYLGGEPGVLSRRWPGYKASDEELVQLALEKLAGVLREKRGAQFRVVLALKLLGNEKAATAEGVLRGFITEKPMAKIIPGFPFRTLFYVPALGKTLGEMSIGEEAAINHRKIALEKLRHLFATRL